MCIEIGTMECKFQLNGMIEFESIMIYSNRKQIIIIIQVLMKANKKAKRKKKSKWHTHIPRIIRDFDRQRHMLAQIEVNRLLFFFDRL